MSFPDDKHSRRCSLCAKFLRQERLNVYDFNAEPLAAECPYYQLQQGLIELSLGPEPSRWRQAIDWEPISSNNIGYLQFDNIGYVARMRSHDYTYEYWDVYLEPGSVALPGFAYAAEPGDYHDSPEALAFVEQCRYTCKRNHPDCQYEDTARILPPRLIRVDEQRLVLIDSAVLPKDSKPAAISGVASKNWWQGESYVAGHWDNGAFISQLRWSPDLRLEADFCDEHALSGAPSWSWLSITQPVVWNMGEDNDLDFISEIYIVEIDVMPSGPDPFGSFVTPGKLIPRARLLDATLRCQQQARKSQLAPIYECTVHHNGETHPVAGVDLRPGTMASVKLFPIEVTRDEFNSFALILSPVRGALLATMPMYERVGHVSIDRYERKRWGGVDHGDEIMQEALAVAEHSIFCIV
ncbi:hypothetical protein MBLNU13_g07417t2 [Cladosporium sp. NU13]